MINLIPPTAKKQITKEYWVRVISVWLFAVSVAGLLVAISLLPVYVLVTSQVGTYASSAKEVAAKVADYDLSASALTMAKRQSALLVELQQLEQFSSLMAAIDDLQGSMIIINDYEFLRAGMAVESVEVKGIADTREALVEFRDNLSALPEVKDVKLPISDLAKDKDIGFTLSVNLNTDNK
ncbi:MAG: hypothetical protein H6779_02425 [Candidatus Nomurabacteria bacterium]|nr:hypothetical protein [Candidatus Nomurabacteria bacterium]USN88278.1 MAG: hypothetical protein H6779_02425 [Candidatus Nomurabacteria bacterium]